MWILDGRVPFEIVLCCPLVKVTHHQEIPMILVQNRNFLSRSYCISSYIICLLVLHKSPTACAIRAIYLPYGVISLGFPFTLPT